MDDEIWHLANDFDKLPARDVLRGVIGDDKKNVARAERELGEDLELLDDALVLYIGALQVAYRNVDAWRDNNAIRTATAMLESTLNYILLIRHAMLLGYFPEARDLLRSCHERISRAFVFFHKEDFAVRFLSGEQIGQKAVDREFSRLQEDPEKSKALFDGLRSRYKSMSEVVHPNLESFVSRHGNSNLAETLGTDVRLGGFTSADIGHYTIMVVLQAVLKALNILGTVFHDQSGDWGRELLRIHKLYQGVIDGLLDEQGERGD